MTTPIINKRVWPIWAVSVFSYTDVIIICQFILSLRREYNTGRYAVRYCCVRILLNGRINNIVPMNNSKEQLFLCILVAFIICFNDLKFCTGAINIATKRYIYARKRYISKPPMHDDDYELLLNLLYSYKPSLIRASISINAAFEELGDVIVRIIAI